MLFNKLTRRSFLILNFYGSIHLCQASLEHPDVLLVIHDDPALRMWRGEESAPVVVTGDPLEKNLHMSSPYKVFSPKGGWRETGVLHDEATAEESDQFQKTQIILGEKKIVESLDHLHSPDLTHKERAGTYGQLLAFLSDNPELHNFYLAQAEHEDRVKDVAKAQYLWEIAAASPESQTTASDIHEIYGTKSPYQKLVRKFFDLDPTDEVAILDLRAAISKFRYSSNTIPDIQMQALDKIVARLDDIQPHLNLDFPKVNRQLWQLAEIQFAKQKFNNLDLNDAFTRKAFDEELMILAKRPDMHYYIPTIERLRGRLSIEGDGKSKMIEEAVAQIDDPLVRFSEKADAYDELMYKKQTLRKHLSASTDSEQAPIMLALKKGQILSAIKTGTTNKEVQALGTRFLALAKDSADAINTFREDLEEAILKGEIIDSKAMAALKGMRHILISEHYPHEEPKEVMTVPTAWEFLGLERGDLVFRGHRRVYEPLNSERSPTSSTDQVSSK